MKRILLLMLVIMVSVCANAQWRLGRITKSMENDFPFSAELEYVGYVKNSNRTYTLFESIVYESQLNRVGNCSEQYFRTHVKPTDFFYGEVTDPRDDYVNIRKGPSTNYPVVFKINVSTCILFKKTGNNWYEVYASKQRFWVEHGYGNALELTFVNDSYWGFKLNELIKVGYIYKDRVKSPRIDWDFGELR